jgi:ribosomal protein S18 acetylase RimI-like enzyme
LLPADRGRGVGSALVQAAKAEARAAGLARLSLGVLPDNVAALLFYRRQGFAEQLLRMGARV